MNGETSHAWAGIHTGRGKSTASILSSLASDSVSPPDPPLKANRQAEEASRRAYSPHWFTSRASIQQVAVQEADAVVEKLPSKCPTATKKSSPSSSENIISTTTKLTNFAAEFGANESSRQVFKFKLPEVAEASAVKVEFLQTVADSGAVDNVEMKVERKPWYGFGSGKQVSLLSGPLLSQLDPLPSITSKLDTVAVLNPSFWNEPSLPTVPEQHAAPAPAPPFPSRLQQFKKKVPWRGKNITISLPRDDERGQKNKAPIPMTKKDVEARLKEWHQQGYYTAGFNFDQSHKTDDETAERQTRSLWPQVIDVNQERQQRSFRVRIPDQCGKLQILIRESHYIFEGVCLEDISSAIYYN